MAIRTEGPSGVRPAQRADGEAQRRLGLVDAQFDSLLPKLKAKTLDLVMLGEEHKDPQNKALMQRYLERAIDAGQKPSHLLVEQPDRDQPFIDSMVAWYQKNRNTPGAGTQLRSEIESYFSKTPARSGVSGAILGRPEHRKSAANLLALAIQNDVKVVCLDPSVVFDGKNRDDVWVERWEKVKREPGFTNAVAGMGQAHANVRLPSTKSWVGAATRVAYQALAVAADTRADRVFGMQVREQSGARVHSIALSRVGDGGLHDATLD